MEIEDKTMKKIAKEDNNKKEFIILNQTIVVNELKTRRMMASQQTKEEIASSDMRIKVNLLNIKKNENEIIHLKARKMIYKFKLREMYIELLNNPDKLL